MLLAIFNKQYHFHYFEMLPMQVQIVKGPLFNRIIKDPFKYYKRVMGFTFCLTTATNTTSIFFDKEKRTFLREHPEITAMALTTKSVYYGILWPAFYLTLVSSPRNALCLWSGVDDMQKALS